MKVSNLSWLIFVCRKSRTVSKRRLYDSSSEGSNNLDYRHRIWCEAPKMGRAQIESPKQTKSTNLYHQYQQPQPPVNNQYQYQSTSSFYNYPPQEQTYAQILADPSSPEAVYQHGLTNHKHRQFVFLHAQEITPFQFSFQCYPYKNLPEYCSEP